MLQSIGNCMPDSHVVIQAGRLVERKQVAVVQSRGLLVSIPTRDLNTTWERWLYASLSEYSMSGHNIYVRLQPREREDNTNLRTDSPCYMVGGWAFPTSKKYLPHEREQQILLYAETGYEPSIALYSEGVYGYLWFLDRPVDHLQGVLLQNTVLKALAAREFHNAPNNGHLDGCFPLPGFPLCTEPNQPHACGIALPNPIQPPRLHPYKKLLVLPSSRASDIRRYFGGMVYNGDIVTRARQLAMRSAQEALRASGGTENDAISRALAKRVLRNSKRDGQPYREIMPDISRRNQWGNAAWTIPAFTHGFHRLTVGQLDDIRIRLQIPDIDEIILWDRVTSELISAGYMWSAVEEFLSRPGVECGCSVAFIQRFYDKNLSRLHKYLGVEKREFLVEILQQIQRLKGRSLDLHLQLLDYPKRRAFWIEKNSLFMRWRVAVRLLKMSGFIISSWELQDAVRPKNVLRYPWCIGYSNKDKAWELSLKILRQVKIWVDDTTSGE